MVDLDWTSLPGAGFFYPPPSQPQADERMVTRAATPKRAATAVASVATPKKARVVANNARVDALVAELKGKAPVGRVHVFELSEAVQHISEVNGGRLARLVAECGAPPFYHEPQEATTFRSMCRIIVGQQLAGAAVRAIWAKFIAALGEDVSAVTPEAVLAHDPQQLRADAGLSGAKVKAIVDLAEHYARGDLSDAMLLDHSLSASALQAKLTAVKGVGPWSSNMFQMFVLHLPDVFPTGDLGVRNGIAASFGLRGSGKNGALDEKKDYEKLEKAMEPYRPYRSVASWYMWRSLETPSFME